MLAGLAACPAWAQDWRLNLYSVEDFSGVPGSSAEYLPYSHDDAYNFLSYAPMNFDYRWAGDSGVRRWQFDGDYDTYNSYGADSAQIAYVHTHGWSGPEGAYLSMGSPWPSYDTSYRGSHAGTPDFRLGNDNLRYLYLTACDMLNRNYIMENWYYALWGVRMVFGFNGTAWDSANYGKYFWEEKASGENLAESWLDSSWRVSHYQSPMVLASGYDSDDAYNKLYNEWDFNSAQAGDTWFAWRWYYAATANAFGQAAGLGLDAFDEGPKTGGDFAASFELNQLSFDESSLLDALSLSAENYTYTTDDEGGFRLSGPQYLVTPEPGAMMDLDQYGAAAMAGDELLMRDAGQAQTSYQTALDYASQLQEYLGVGPLELSTVRNSYEQGMDKQKHTISQEALSEITFVFSQDFDGLGVSSPDSAGVVEISIDPRTGKLSGLDSSLVGLESQTDAQAASLQVDLEQIRQTTLNQLTEQLEVDPGDLAILDDYSRIGYKVVDDQARLIYHCEAVINGSYRISQDFFLD